MLTMSILGIFASVAGCKKAPVDDTSALENPPPKPPNCPDLPELKNITLKDGTVVDVRIVQFRDTKIYFPTKWLNGNFIDLKRNTGTGFIGKGALQNSHPDIYLNECPGVVHRLAGEEAHAKGNYPVILLEMTDSRRKILIESPDFSVIYFGLNGKIDNSHALWLSNLIHKIEYSQSVVIGLRRTGPSGMDQGMRYESQSVLDFTKWLATPPVRRDNEREFVLKLDKVIKR